MGLIYLIAILMLVVGAICAYEAITGKNFFTKEPW